MGSQLRKTRKSFKSFCALTLQHHFPSTPFCLFLLKTIFGMDTSTLAFQALWIFYFVFWKVVFC